jgi:D-beta-D-heptose 7-phosphate kinase/D-beta-D-heptose 1-phosphate adenosyltransferase
MIIKSKIKNVTQLKKIISDLKAKHKKIVFTNGCFDLLHFGHVKYLEKAKKKGDVLIVGLNSDSSIRKIKGKMRPFVNQRQRAYILSSLIPVDYVVIFNQKTPYNLIKSIKPDILVKGADWPKDKIVGRDILESYSGKVETVPYIKGFSTTDLAKKIVSQMNK